MKEVDINKDNVIDYSEFLEMMRRDLRSELRKSELRRSELRASRLKQPSELSKWLIILIQLISP